jgi:cell division septum initiation protein DivIVA
MVTPPRPAPSASPAHGGAPGFESALRGYDRRQVDEFVAAGRAEVEQLRAELAEARRQQQAAAQHVEAVERELRDLRTRPASTGSGAPEEGFGARVEKLLRLAEQEAAEARSSATGEAAVIIEKARTEAEQHRHEVEQTLAARTSLLEQESTRRAAELEEREQRIEEQAAAAREEAEQVRAAAALAADRLREESGAAAEETRRRAEAEAERLRERAEQELARITALRAGVRTDLARLARVLAAELDGPDAGAVPEAGAAPEPAAAPTAPPTGQVTGQVTAQPTDRPAERGRPGTASGDTTTGKATGSATAGGTTRH